MIFLRNHIIKIISTFFYIGYLPFIPGTFGSLAAIFLFCIIRDSTAVYLLFTCLLMILGFLTSGEAERIMNKKDPGCIVIDEVSGMFIGLLFLPYYDFNILTAAFLLFRIFDTVKPYPAWRLQKLKGSIGVMSDDIIAGIYTNIVLQAVFRCASCRAS